LICQLSLKLLQQQWQRQQCRSRLGRAAAARAAAAAITAAGRLLLPARLLRLLSQGKLLLLPPLLLLLLPPPLLQCPCLLPRLMSLGYQGGLLRGHPRLLGPQLDLLLDLQLLLMLMLLLLLVALQALALLLLVPLLLVPLLLVPLLLVPLLPVPLLLPSCLRVLGQLFPLLLHQVTPTSCTHLRLLIHILA
jgi:hypothetical protein